MAHFAAQLIGMKLRITQYGEPILRQKGERITQFDDALKQLAADMVATMRAAEGVGLAAQQIGRAELICVVDVSGLEPSELDYTLDGKRPPIDLIMPLTLINPTLKILPGRTVTGEEGCLSFPGVSGEVTRPERIEVSYRDLDGSAHTLEVGGWFARVIQHEYDHLQGVLFIDHFDQKTRRLQDKRIKLIRAEGQTAAAESAP